MSGLVQDYSKSPIRATFDRAEIERRPSITNIAPGVPDALDQSFIPAFMQYQPSPYSQSNSARKYSVDFSAPPPRRTSVDVGAPPRRTSIDARIPSPSKTNFSSRPSPPPPLLSTTSNRTNSFPSPPISDRPESPARATYAIPNHTPMHQPGAIAVGPPGYRQNPIHDGGSTEYSGNPDGQSSREIAEQAWQSVTQVAGSAGETVGKALEGGWGSVKTWLNPESKGMR